MSRSPASWSRASRLGPLGLLAASKRRIAGQIPSRALLADSWLSLAGTLTAVCAVVGTAMNAAFGWWWIDPGAALCIALGAMVLAAINARDLRTAIAVSP